MKPISSRLAKFLLAGALVGFQAIAGTGGFSGKVTETMDAGGYTYVLVDTSTNKVWAAATKFQVKPGDLVTVPEAMPMTNFHSQSLNRDFPVIYFAGSIKLNGANAAALPAGHPPMAGQAPPLKRDFTGLKPAKDGKSVAEIYATSARLEGKSVKVRGKVVKYNANILGKNWLHIQDGTGSAGSNDLLVTTTGASKMGDTVLVEGKVAMNKDFGGGYKYSLLIEEAKVTVE